MNKSLLKKTIILVLLVGLALPLAAEKKQHIKFRFELFSPGQTTSFEPSKWNLSKDWTGTFDSDFAVDFLERILGYSSDAVLGCVGYHSSWPVGDGYVVAKEFLT
jgi:hypothetical protein